MEAESEHFVLRGDLGEEAARAALLNLEQVRAALLTGTWHAQTQPPVKTHVILLANELELSGYVRNGVLGYAASDPFEAPLLVASAGTRLDELAVLKHELAHHIDNAFLLRQPRWLAEGLASYLETVTLRRDGGATTLGAVNEGRLSHLRRAPQLELDWVMHLGPELYSLQRDELEDFYAQSWLLVHYLVNHRRAQLEAFVDRLAKAEDPDAAWAQSFGKLGPEQLERELRGYLENGKFNTYAFPLAPLRPELRVRPLSRADALAELALLRSISFGAATPHTAALAALEAEAALRADPTSPLAAGIWFVTGARERQAQVAVARAVVHGHPDDSRGYELLGFALGAEQLSEQIAAFETAVRLAPDDARALAQLSFAELAAGREADALAAARKAVALAPGNPSYLDGLALSLAASGDCTGAPAVEQRAIDMIPEGNKEQLVAHLRERLDEFAQICLAQKGGVRARFVPAPADAR